MSIKFKINYMTTLKINIPEGFKIGTFDQNTGEVNFIPLPKDIKERIKNFDDVLIENGIDIEDFNNSLDGFSKDEIAYVKVKQIVKAFNEGWVPDWTNSNQYKYVPWFKMGSPSGVGFSYVDYGNWFSVSSVGSRLCFKSADLAKHAGKIFEDIYKDFLTA